MGYNDNVKQNSVLVWIIPEVEPERSGAAFLNQLRSWNRSNDRIGKSSGAGAGAPSNLPCSNTLVPTTSFVI